MEQKQIYWEPEIETAPREHLKRIQLEKLRALVKRVYENSAYYKQRFDELGIKPSDIQNVDDFRKIPLTTYSHDIPPEQLLAIPFEVPPSSSAVEVLRVPQSQYI